MVMSLCRESVHSSLVASVMEISGQKINRCYQCGKCTAGCPMADHMDVSPTAVMRAVMLGDVEALLCVRSIWYCTSCFQCGTRCPKGIEVHRVFEALRCLSLRAGVNYSDLAKLPEDIIDAVPQQAMIAGFRKFESLE